MFFCLVVTLAHQKCMTLILALGDPKIVLTFIGSEVQKGHCKHIVVSEICIIIFFSMNNSF